MGDRVTSIGRYAFNNCESLSSAVTIPDSVTSLGEGTFNGCTSLTEVAIGNGIGSIADKMCHGCTRLTSVTIADSVTSIGGHAFDNCGSLATVAIPNSITSIGEYAFYNCSSLASVSVGFSVTNLMAHAFDSCISLIRATIPDSVTSIGEEAFDRCWSLTSVTIGKGITSIRGGRFEYCQRLSAVYFQGDAPSVPLNPGLPPAIPPTIPDVFGGAEPTVYYLPGTTGWSPTFNGRPTAVWKPQVQTSGVGFGVQTNQFGFNITWGSDRVIVVEACANLVNPIWSPLQTNTLIGGSIYFSDPKWTDYPGRFYRLHSP